MKEVCQMSVLKHAIEKCLKYLFKIWPNSCYDKNRSIFDRYYLDLLDKHEWPL